MRATAVKRLANAVACSILLSGCATAPPGQSVLRLEESTLEVRSVQTRKLAAPSEAAVLAASVAVLQDMEFNIDRVERPLGILTASRVSDADDSGQKAGLFLLELICIASRDVGCDSMSKARDKQRVVLTMVVLPSLQRREEFAVRVTIQRLIFDKAGRTQVAERIVAPEVYQEVFDNLRRALHLEAVES